MKTNIITIPYKVDHKRITILPLEVHYSKRAQSNGFSHKTFKEVIHRLLTEPDTYAVFPGDLIDSDRPSMRSMKHHIYADEDRRSAQAEDDDDHRRTLDIGIIADLKPVAHKIWGMLDGDHFRLYQNGMTSTQYICHALGIPHTYLGRRQGWIMLRITRGLCSHCLTIHVRHGKSAAASIGTDINKLMSQSQGFISDLYIGGHTHRKWVYSLPFIGINKLGEQYSKPIGWARAGSLLEGYPKDGDTYAGDLEYKPLPMGYPDVYLNFERHHGADIFLESIRGLS